MRIRVLSEIQSKILLALLHQGKSSSVEILKQVGISGSTWNKEKLQLQNTGLIEGQTMRGLTENGVVRKTEFTLTGRGKSVAQHLLSISSVIENQSTMNNAALEKVPELTVKYEI